MATVAGDGSTLAGIEFQNPWTVAQYRAYVGDTRGRWRKRRYLAVRDLDSMIAGSNAAGHPVTLATDRLVYNDHGQ